jgi:hypothetical protein
MAQDSSVVLDLLSEDVTRKRPWSVHSEHQLQEWSTYHATQVDLQRPMSEIRAQLSQYPVRTRLSLTGTLVVARDIAHAKLQASGGVAGHDLRVHSVVTIYAVERQFCRGQE